jgi:hypothetical protein
VDAHLPSPFTVPALEDQGLHWDKEVALPPPPQHYTLGHLLADLQQFGETYQREAAALRHADAHGQRYAGVQLEALVSASRASLLRIPGFNELRTFAYATWGKELTAAGCRRILAALLHGANGTVSVAEAEQLTLAVAAARLTQPVSADGARLRHPTFATSPQADQGRTPTAPAVHNADFTMVKWFGTEYHFALGVQSSAVRALWAEWEQTGLGLHQETIREAIDAERDNFRMDTPFRNHPAWGTMIRRCGDGRYRLAPPDTPAAPATPKAKRKRRRAPKSRRRRV